MILRNSLIINVRYMMAQKSDEVRKKKRQLGCLFFYVTVERDFNLLGGLHRDGSQRLDYPLCGGTVFQSPSSGIMVSRRSTRRLNPHNRLPTLFLLTKWQG